MMLSFVAAKITRFPEAITMHSVQGNLYAITVYIHQNLISSKRNVVLWVLR